MLVLVFKLLLLCSHPLSYTLLYDSGVGLLQSPFSFFFFFYSSKIALNCHREFHFTNTYSKFKKGFLNALFRAFHSHQNSSKWGTLWK